MRIVNQTGSGRNLIHNELIKARKLQTGRPREQRAQPDMGYQGSFNVSQQSIEAERVGTAGVFSASQQSDFAGVSKTLKGQNEDYEQTDYAKFMPHSQLWFVNQNPFVLRQIEQLAKHDDSYRVVEDEGQKLKSSVISSRNNDNDFVRSKMKDSTALP